MPSVLIAEPDSLLRWSLVTYLGRWFSVIAAETPAAAVELAAKRRFDAVVLADSMADADEARIEQLVRSQNPDAGIVHTVSSPSRAAIVHATGVALEKPFDLSRLAGILGVAPGSQPA